MAGATTQAAPLPIVNKIVTDQARDRMISRVLIRCNYQQPSGYLPASGRPRKTRIDRGVNTVGLSGILLCGVVGLDFNN